MQSRNRGLQSSTPTHGLSDKVFKYSITTYTTHRNINFFLPLVPSLSPSSLPLSPLSPSFLPPSLSPLSLIQSCFQGLVLVYVLETLYSNVQRYLDSSGYCVVNRIIYGSDVPLFQLDAVQSFDCFSLRKLLAQLPKLNRKLETEFEGMYSDIHCNVKRVFSRLSCINSHSFRVH